jgi:hypothetical protein
MKIEVFKRASENWHDNCSVTGSAYVSSLVAVVIDVVAPGVSLWRVGVYGTEYGLERQFNTESEAMYMFLYILRWGYVNKKQLEANGFSLA